MTTLPMVLLSAFRRSWFFLVTASVRPGYRDGRVTAATFILSPRHTIGEPPRGAVGTHDKGSNLRLNNVTRLLDARAPI